jgi:hypothetical protein
VCGRLFPHIIGETASWRYFHFGMEMEQENGTEAEGIILEIDGGGVPNLEEMKVSLVTNTEALDRIQTSQQKMITGIAQRTSQNHVS